MKSRVTTLRAVLESVFSVQVPAGFKLKPKTVSNEPL